MSDAAQPTAAEVRAAAEAVKTALDRHLAAVERRTGEDDQAVYKAFNELAAAAEVYDELLYDRYDEVTPFEIPGADDSLPPYAGPEEPNALSVLRLILVPVFLYLLLVMHENAWAVAILMFSGFSDWADGKIARLVANQSSKLGALLDPAVDRIYMIAVPVALAVAGIVPWWLVITLVVRDGLLAGTLPILRSRGLTALPVAYIGKAATFALMSGFPLVLLGQWDALWSRVILACGWAFVIWGMAMYLWSGVLYLIQVRMVLALPRVGVSVFGVPPLAGESVATREDADE